MRCCHPSGGVSDFTDILLADDCASEASQVLTGALMNERDWHVIDLREVRPQAAAQLLFDIWPGGRRRIADSTCLQLPAGTIEPILAGLSGRTANTVRRKLRKIDALDIRVSSTEEATAGSVIAELLRLHERQWQGRDIDVEHLRPRFAAHLASAVCSLIAQDKAELVQYRMGDTLVACELLVVGHDFVGDYLRGVDPELRKMIDVTAMLVRHNLIVTQRRERGVYSMLRGIEPHKMRWRPEPVHNQRLLLSRTKGILGASYVAAVRVRRLADEMEERSPGWRRFRRQVRKIRAHRVTRVRDV